MKDKNKIIRYKKIVKYKEDVHEYVIPLLLFTIFILPLMIYQTYLKLNVREYWMGAIFGIVIMIFINLIWGIFSRRESYWVDKK